MRPETAGGSCLCGAVGFTIELPTRACVHCHCTMCRRNHGAGYVTWVVADASGFEVTRGKGRLTTYASSSHGTRSFCSVCGSSLFCTNDAHPEIVDIVLANFDGDLDRPPQGHYYLDDRIDWLPIDETLPAVGP